MGISELLQWQWNGYPKYHQSKANLLIHIITVPIFITCTAAMTVMLFKLNWLGALITAILAKIAFAVQGIGHKREPNTSVPFSNPANAALRMFFEQWLTFPRFVLSGGWLRAYKSAV